MSVPVSRTYEDADVLLVSSVNEGITLTTIEAISDGVPVLSANVGSQETLVSPTGTAATYDFVVHPRRETFTPTPV